MVARGTIEDAAGGRLGSWAGGDGEDVAGDEGEDVAGSGSWEGRRRRRAAKGRYIGEPAVGCRRGRMQLAK